jgi:cytolysin-activating lysine-acyltransferase
MANLLDLNEPSQQGHATVAERMQRLPDDAKQATIAIDTGDGNVAANVGQPTGFTPQQMAAVESAKQKVNIFGQIMWLMMQSEEHKHLFLSDFEWRVLPAIRLNQFRLWQNMGMPQAFVSWALFDEFIEGRFVSGNRRIHSSEWRRGESLWLIDVVTPFGGRDEAMRNLKDQVFLGQRAKVVQPASGQEGQFKIVEI